MIATSSIITNNFSLHHQRINIDKFIIKMLNYRLKPRLEMTAMEGNILMTQIRAEKKNYVIPHTVPPTISCQKQPTGKKIFK